MTKKKESVRVTAQAPKDKGPMVYCGPSIPGVARQYTVYHGGIPDALSAEAADNPTLGLLILPLARLPEAMKSINSRSGHIYRLFSLVKAKQAEKKEA